MAGGLVTFSWLDETNERSATRIKVVDVTDGNLAATLTSLNALTVAMQAISYCYITDYSFLLGKFPKNPLKPTNRLAQRENKWEVLARDTVLNTVHRFEIPGPMYDTVHKSAGSDYADLTQPAIDSFVTAFNNVAKSAAGNALAVVSMKYSGRNL